jgi:hypothetical protein
MPDLLNAIAARVDAMRMLTAGIAPYSSGFGDPAQDFWNHAQGDLAWLLDDLKAARKVVEACRAHVRAEALDSSYGATSWSMLRDAVGEYDWRHEKPADA